MRAGFARAVEAHRRHELDRAESLYRELLRRDRRQPLVLHQLGLLLHAAGRTAEAHRALADAERLVPDHPGLLLNQARLLAGDGHAREAAVRLERLHAGSPDAGDIACELATARANGGAWRLAIDDLARFLDSHPDDHDVRLLLGDLHLSGGDDPEALECWRTVSEAGGDRGDAARHRIGNLHLRLGDAVAATAAFSGAATRGGSASWVHSGLAAAAGERGDFAEMKREAEVAVALDPLNSTAWYQLTMTPAGCTDATERGLRQALARRAGNPEFWLLHLALGRVLDRRGRRDEAFAAFSRAHALKGRLPDHRYRDFETEFGRVRARLGPDFVERMGHFAPVRIRPVFIVGMPRSGTTLVESILAGHPDVAAGGEMRLVEAWVARHGGAAAGADISGWIGKLDRRTFATLREAWERSLRTVAAPAPCVTDKLPENFIFLGALAAAFPAAGIVHVHRGALDTCVSCFTTALAGQRAASLPTLESLGGYYRGYRELMDFWQRVLPGRIIDVSYEALVREPEAAVRRLLGALGLEWDPGLLAFHQSARPVSTASLYQVRRPINTDSLGQWRRFSGHLGALRDALGEHADEPADRS